MTDTDPALHERLKQFGLTDNDARIYVYMLERGVPLASSKVAAALSLHRQYAHTSLQKLLSLELVEKIPEGARTKYRALPPQYLTHLAKRQMENAERAVRELDQISGLGAQQDFEIYRGVKNVTAFEETLVDNLPEKETQYIIGGGAEAFISFFGERYEEITHMARARGLRSKYVGSPAELPWLERARKANASFEYVILDSLPKTIVQTVVRFDSVTIYTFATPPLVYIIKSKAVAEDYKKFFDMLWNIAKSKGN